MNPHLLLFLKLFTLTAVITVAMFYLFQEDRDCVTDWGSKCSNGFFIRCLVQTIVMSCIFYFSKRRAKRES